MNVTLNHEQRLFVIPTGDGYSCLGFNRCFDETSQLAERLGEPPPREDQRGKIEQYLKYQDLLSKAREIALGTWFHRNTPKAISDILESARKSGSRLRLFYGDTQTGRDWLEEHDVIGTIGRSTGALKVPLLIASSRSMGGGPILDHCIVRIIDVEDTRRELYRHPRYVTPSFDLCHGSMIDAPWVAVHGGRIHARFKTEKRAQRWIAFMRGERFAK